MVKKFSAPLERTARLLDLVPYISSHQGVSLKELSVVFGVTQAQMTDDLTTLWMCGLPGYTPLELMDLDFESGFVTIHNAETLAKPRSITFDEGAALLLGLDLLRSSISPDRSDLLMLIQQLSLRLSTLINLPSALSATPAANQQHTSEILQAIKSKSGVEISYHSLYRDELSTRRIYPIEVIESDGHQYLSSYCYTASDFRQFRIDRIQSAQSFVIDAEIPSPKFEATSFTSSIEVIAPTREISERFKQDQLPVNSTFEFESYSQQWIQRAVIASGGGVSLQSPPEIRSSIAGMAQSMLDRYKEL
jgi:proteasome accessory factor C